MPTIAILFLSLKELRHCLHAENETISLAETSELPTIASTTRTWCGQHDPKQTLDKEAETDVEASTEAALAAGAIHYITAWLITRLDNTTKCIKGH